MLSLSSFRFLISLSLIGDPFRRATCRRLRLLAIRQYAYFRRPVRRPLAICCWMHDGGQTEQAFPKAFTGMVPPKTQVTDNRWLPYPTESVSHNCAIQKAPKSSGMPHGLVYTGFGICQRAQAQAGTMTSRPSPDTWSSRLSVRN